MTPPKGINIIRHRGEPNKADFYGVPIARQKSIVVVVDEKTVFAIPCAEYDNHFIFEVPKVRGEIVQGPAHMCTCGSSAVVKDYESPIRLFVCHFYQTNGFHTTSVINKDDFYKTAGEVLIPKGRKWLI